MMAKTAGSETLQFEKNYIFINFQGEPLMEKCIC